MKLVALFSLGTLCLYAAPAIAQAPQRTLLELPQNDQEMVLELDNTLELLSPGELDALYSDSVDTQAAPAYDSAQDAPPIEAISPDFVTPRQEERPLFPEALSADEGISVPAALPIAESAPDVLAYSDEESDFYAAPVRVSDSLMFSQQEFESITQALNDYQARRVTDSETVVVEAGTVAQPIGEDYLVITLNSLLYMGENQWSAWINGTRFSPQKLEALPRITLQDINKDRAIIQITPLQQAQTSNESPATEDASYRVSLLPNQSYILADQKVLEGTVANRRIKQLWHERKMGPSNGDIINLPPQ